MMNRLLALLLILMPFILHAQINNVQGDIYLSSGEVVSGEIIYYYDQPGDIFIMDSIGSKAVYHPDDISTILLDNGKKFTTQNYVDDKGAHLLVFQSIIESSHISLYGRQENSVLAMYVSKDDKLIRLDNKEITFKKDNKTYKKFNNRYIGILTSLMSDRPDLVANMQKIKFSEQDITDVILNYNKGDVTYYQKSDSKYYMKPIWMMFIEYSNICSFYSELVTDPSFNISAGFQYYFRKNSRNSIKMSIEYASLKFEDEDGDYIGVGLGYQIDFYKTRSIDVYGMLHLMDIVYISSTSNKTNEVEDMVGVLPRFSPGLGMDVDVFPKFAVYGEVNNLFGFKCIPSNFSFGFKYDLGK